MKRRDFIGIIGSAAVASPFALRAQTSGRVPLVALSFNSGAADPYNKDRAEDIKGQLTQLGWVEGRNIRYELFFADGNANLAQANAQRILAAAPDVILTSTTLPTVAIQAAATKVPVVFVYVTDPVLGGFVASLAHPGGNMTGFTPFEYQIAGKWLQLLHQIAPDITRVAMLGDPANHNFLGFWSAIENIAAKENIVPIKAPVENAGDIERHLRALASQGNGGLVISAAQFSTIHRELIFRLAAELKLPAIYWSRFFADTGGLVSYGPNAATLYRQSATYVDRILRGEKPENLPVQAPTAFEMVINLKTANALGLAIPPLVLARADEVIE